MWAKVFGTAFKIRNRLRKIGCLSLMPDVLDCSAKHGIQKAGKYFISSLKIVFCVYQDEFYS
jgi:hypothetical protein